MKNADMYRLCARLALSLSICLWLASNQSVAGKGFGFQKAAPTRVFVISIGVSYQNDTAIVKPLPFLFNSTCPTCLSDAKGIGDYFRKIDSTAVTYKFINSNTLNIDTLFSVFKAVKQEATASDVFVFYYAGISWGVINNSGTKENEGFYAINRIQDSIQIQQFSFSLKLLKVLTDRIAAQRQLIIFDTGEGNVIENDFYRNFFTNDPSEAFFTKKNRIILCPEHLSSEVLDEKSKTSKGDLFYTISNMPISLSVLTLFDTSMRHDYSEGSYKKFKKTWYELQTRCRAQIKILKELDYLNILSAIKPRYENAQRGVQVLPTLKVDSSVQNKRKKALIIATDVYSAPMWKQLRNPVNDGVAVAKILKEKYGYEVDTLFNAERNTIMDAVSALCDSASNPSSQYLLYFAGHGLYEPRTSAGYIVCKGSKQLNDASKPKPLELDSYLDYAVLMRNIDASLNKVVFITDVCFGGTSLNSVFSSNARVTPKNEETKEQNPFKVILASGVTEVDDYVRLQTGISRNSPFATSLLNALTTNTGSLDFEELFSNIKKKHLQPQPVRFPFGQVVQPNEFIF